MFRTALMILLLASLTGSAWSQTLAENMTCDELIATFESVGVVYKRVHGKPMAMKAGIPVRNAAGLQCGPRNYTLQRASARTVDKRSCVYALICYGKTNTEIRRAN